MATTLHPEILWAQRSSATIDEKNIVYVTVNLPDIKEGTLKFDLTATGFTFAAQAGNADKGLEEKNFAAKVDFYEDIDLVNSSKKLSSRALYLILRKKEKKVEFWPRLTKDKQGRVSHIKTDFDKWVDEDEQEGIVDVPDDDFGGLGGGGPGGGGGGGGFDPSMLSGLGGGGGLGGGNPDFEKMMAAMGGGKGFGGPSGGDDSDDDEGPPPLEDAEDA